MKRFFSEMFSITISVIIALVLYALIRTFLFYPFQVEGSSMYPTMKEGERFILNKTDAVERFEIVVFPAPDGSGDQYVKRVIGMPGDTISYENNQLFVNEEPIEEEYLAELKAANPNQLVTENFTLESLTGEAEVPEDSYFVLGDNRPVSHDSRQFHFIDEEAVEGTAHWRFLPLDEFGRVQ